MMTIQPPHKQIHKTIRMPRMRSAQHKQISNIVHLIALLCLGVITNIIRIGWSMHVYTTIDQLLSASSEASNKRTRKRDCAKVVGPQKNRFLKCSRRSMVRRQAVLKTQNPVSIVLRTGEEIVDLKYAR